MKPRYFEDFAEGDRVVTQGITLTDANIIDYGLRFDPQPIHIDKIAAEQGFYNGLIASGWQVAALAFRLFWQSGFIYGGSLGSPGVDELRWLKPVRPGDTLTAWVECADKVPSKSRPAMGVIHEHWTAVNQNGELVMTSKGVNMVRRRPV